MKRKILVIGVGSIGKRHIKNITSYFSVRNIECELDIVRSGKGAPLDEDLSSLIHRVYTYNSDIMGDYDAIFITNPTSLHYETLKKYSGFSKGFFIEKPVFGDTTFDFDSLKISNDVICYVACPLRYKGVLQYIKNNIDLKKVLSIRSICSSYLPEWRTGTDYRETYSAYKIMGGGVSSDLIHEWDYLSWIFGKPDEVQNIIAKVSNLEISSDDLALYIGKNRNMTFEVHLDYFGRQTIRTFQIFLSDDTIEVDLVKGTIAFFKENRTVDLPEDGNACYIKEIEHFFDILDGKCPNDNSIESAVSILQIAKGECAK